MTSANIVFQYLDRKQVDYTALSHPRTRTLEEAAEACGIDPRHLARAVLLQDARGVVLAILPATHLLDFRAISEHLGRDLAPAPEELVSATFAGCESGSVPPLEHLFGLRAIMDSSLLETEPVYLEPGSHEALVRMSRHAFLGLHPGCQCAAIGCQRNELHSEIPSEFLLPEEYGETHTLDRLRPPGDLAEQIRRVEKLPALPEMAARLLRLRNDPRATVEDLAEIVATDPGLAAQVLRYARSAFFNYRGRITSIQDAIARVLGFDTVMNMALGLATSRSLRIPPDGPLGQRAFWRHATLSAALAQALCPLLPRNLGVKPGIAYLAGLLQNLGFLLEGHLIKNEFFLLNQIVAANPEIPVLLIEKRVLGIDHTETGTLLTQAWNLPDEIITTIREHHNPDYRGEHAAYANLVLLTNHLLKARGIGDASDGELPQSVVTALALGTNRVIEVAERIFAADEELENMAQQLCA